MIYGYHRTSTTDQHLDRGITEIETFCKNNNMVLEKSTQTNRRGRTLTDQDTKVLKRIF